MFDRGYWHVATLRGMPVRLHWTLPLGALLLSGGNFAPAFWIAFTLLILLHELGHAAIVRRFGHRTLSIDITGFGGLCRWSGHATPFERSAIAWGGVLAQAILLIATLLALLLLGSPTSPHAAQLVDAFTRANLILIVINLLPFPPLDGAEAWQILRHGRAHRWLARVKDKLARPRTKLRPRPSSQKPGKVVDLQDYARRKRVAKEDDVAHNAQAPKGSPKDVADELIRIAEEAARARDKRNEN